MNFEAADLLDRPKSLKGRDWPSSGIIILMIMFETNFDRKIV